MTKLGGGPEHAAKAPPLTQKSASSSSANRPETGDREHGSVRDLMQMETASSSRRSSTGPSSRLSHELPHYARHLSAQLRQDVHEELQGFLAEFISSVTDVWSMGPNHEFLQRKSQVPLDAVQADMQHPLTRSQTRSQTLLFDREDTWHDGDVELWNSHDDDPDDVLGMPSLLCHRVANVMQQELQNSITAEANKPEPTAKSRRRSYIASVDIDFDEGAILDCRQHSPKLPTEPFVPGGNSPETIERRASDTRTLLRLETETDHESTGAVQERQKNCMFVLSIEFEQMIGLLVVLNAITIGFETDFQAKYVGVELPGIYHWIDASFCLAFSLELCLKLHVLGNWIFFCGPNMGWNSFDFLVVGFQVADYVTQIFGHHHKKKNSGLNVTLFRLLRLMRLARIVRVIRAFHLVEDLRTIVASIAASIQSLCWALLVLFIMVYGVSICFTHLVIDAKKAKADTLLDRDILEHWYGSLFRTMLTMFECIAGGVSWDDAASPLIENISPWAGALFVVYIAFSLFALCNVVTGVFVEKAMECAKEKDDDKLVGYLKGIFHRADTSGSGEIDWEAFESRLTTAEMREYFKIIDVDMSEAQGIFRLLDVDGGGTVSPLEFVSGCMRLRGNAKAVELSLLMYETKKMNEWLKGKIGLLEQRVTWIGNTLKRSIRATQFGGDSPKPPGFRHTKSQFDQENISDSDDQPKP